MITEAEKRFLKRLIEMYGVDNAAVHYKDRTKKEAPSEYLLVEDESEDEGIDLNNM